MAGDGRGPGVARHRRHGLPVHRSGHGSGGAGRGGWPRTSRRAYPSGRQLPRGRGRPDRSLRAGCWADRQAGDRAHRGGTVSPAGPGLRLGRIGAWLNPVYGDDARTGLAIQAESLGYPTAWLGFGRAPVSDLALAERILDATSTITVATAIVNMWTNEAADVAASYRRIAARHSARFLLGIGIGHPESVTAYRQPHATMVNYLDQLDGGGAPPDRRTLAALGPRALHLTAERTLGTHPLLNAPDHTRAARQMLGPGAVIAPEHAVVLDTDPDRARATGRAFVSDPYLKLSSYTTNLRRYGYTDADIDDGGSDRLIDALVLHGSPGVIAAGLRSHLDAGADHGAIQVLTGNGNDPIPAYRQLARVLL